MLDNAGRLGQNIDAEQSEPPAAHIGDDVMLPVNSTRISLLENDKIPSREDIVRLQDAMIPIRCEQPDPIHHFCTGMYARELTIPAGMLIVGKIHKHDHFLFVLSGKAEIASEFGKEIVETGHFSISKAGVKRVVLAIEDTKFMTIHSNKYDSTDLDVIENEHIEPEEVIRSIQNKIFEVLP